MDAQTAQTLMFCLLALANVLLLAVAVRLFFVKNREVPRLQARLEELLAVQAAALDARQEKQADALARQLDDQAAAMDRRMSILRTELTATNVNTTKDLGDSLQNAVGHMGRQMGESQALQMQMLERRLKALEESTERRLEAIRVENSKKLDEIRRTVDEQLQDALQKRLTESFQTVSAQLEQVHKGLGEMQTLAADVGGLKQVLSGVKTRGILGEIQLGAILEEILAPEQYAANVATVPGSANRVEYAVRLPGQTGESTWLPIDAKFPGDTYAHLQKSYESGDAAAVEAARKALITVLCSEAKDISTKYIAPPSTTNFAIMFLPFEGLYAEAVNLGLVERLQRDYRVNVAGPSTMAALLNSLQMGFRTLAIQKRSNEVWQVLAAVKTEFDKFGDGLEKMRQRLRQTDEELDKLIGTRTRAINRRLRGVQQLDAPESARLLELDADTARWQKDDEV